MHVVLLSDSDRGRDCDRRRLGGDIDRLVAEGAAERGTEREPDPLDERRREGQADGVEVRIGDHREPERVRHSLAVRLAVGGQREHRLEQRLELEGGPHLADEVRLLVTCVPEPVRRPGRHRQPPARARDELLPPDLEADAAAKHLEALLLARMDMGRRDEAVRLDEGLDHHGLAVRLARCLAKDDALAGDGVVNRVSCMNHVVLLPVVRVGSTVEAGA